MSIAKVLTNTFDLAHFEFKDPVNATYIPLYLEQQLNVNRTVRLQWKVGHI